MADCAWLVATGKQAKEMARYGEITSRAPVQKRIDYAVSDVVEMFRGKGKLCS